jgi:hypothetical protein
MGEIFKIIGDLGFPVAAAQANAKFHDAMDEADNIKNKKS